jgi:hypothetical protein
MKVANEFERSQQGKDRGCGDACTAVALDFGRAVLRFFETKWNDAVTGIKSSY